MRILIVIFLFLSANCFSEEKYGKVCFGKNLAKPAIEHTDSLTLVIGESEKLLFNKKYESAVLAHLELDKNYIVQVYLGNEKGSSWILNFNKLKTTTVIISRNAGSWQMEPASKDNCQ